MIVTYNGRNYSGFARQKSANTIQGELEKAIFTITKQQVVSEGSGRTDAGVSAYFQPVHFDIDEKLNLNKFLRSINGLLPQDIRVLSVVPTDLHARFSTKRKTYLYKMYMSNISLPLYSDALQVSPEIDLKLAKKFLRLIVGTHDFACFQSVGSPKESTVRTIYSAKLYKKGLYLYFTITGNGFLYKMVRNIVGTMLAVASGKIDFSTLKPTIFNGFKSTNCAKPEFLYLLNVEYN